MVQDKERIAALRRAIASGAQVVDQADILQCHSAAALIETAIEHLRHDLEAAERKSA